MSEIHDPDEVERAKHAYADWGYDESRANEPLVDPDEAQAVADVLAERERADITATANDLRSRNVIAHGLEDRIPAPDVTSVLLDYNEIATLIASLYSLSSFDTNYLHEKLARAARRLEERQAT